MTIQVKKADCDRLLSIELPDEYVNVHTGIGKTARVRYLLDLYCGKATGPVKIKKAKVERVKRKYVWKNGFDPRKKPLKGNRLPGYSGPEEIVLP